jgi:hypothetical protein
VDAGTDRCRAVGAGMEAVGNQGRRGDARPIRMR